MPHQIRDAHAKDYKDMAALVLSIIGVPEADRNYNAVLNEFIQRSGIGTHYVLIEDLQNQTIEGLAAITTRGSFAQLIGPLIKNNVPEPTIMEFIEYIEQKAQTLGATRIASQLPSGNNIINYLKTHNYQKTKTIVEHWQGIPNFIEPPVNDDITIQPITPQDIEPAYNLIKDTMDLEAGLYLTYQSFKTMAQQSNEKENEAWVVAKNKNNVLEGFSASFKINSPIQPGEQDVIIYGPKAHSKEAMALILAEVINYWKLKGARRFIIVREKTDPEEALYLQTLGFKRGLEVVNLEKNLKTTHKK